ncbi:unnamed protein product [Dovyalis caffra]|uniref:Leucine-rich repeat-containing N-terminal plant-type domain-containing protein n=1 Tax=Dovyalis caffra TaxID=77055 RepID=A0AAV1QT20_9ROSI|nr:unnamed protein product [Dovyalis caffra]
MKSYCRTACCFLFLFFLSPANSTFTSLSQTSSRQVLGQQCIGSDKTALLQLKRDLSAAKPESTSPLQPYSGSFLASWKPNTDCCSWEGVTCHEVTTHVIGLNLSGHNLSVLVNSTKFLNLPYLERLNLVNCSIREIPSFVQKLGGLVELDLSKNKIRGQVPKWIWHLENLVYLNLSNNFLNGMEAPPSASFLSSLAFFDVSSNLLEGSIPTLPPSISFLSLAKNKLTGEIPKCDDGEDLQPSGAQQESILSESDSPFSWKFALVGYGCGVPVGVALGYILFWKTKRCSKWIEQSFKAKKRQRNEQNRRRR